MEKRSLKELFNIFKYPLLLLIIYLAAYPLYEYWWTDIVAHFLGGAAICISWYYVFEYTGFLKDFKKLPKYWQVLIMVGLVVLMGVLWEIFEVLLDRLIGSEELASWRTDTMGDLIMDILGAGIGFWIIRKY